MWLLDANVCIQFLKGKNAMLLERFTAIPQADKYLCSVVAGELYYGACKLQRIAENMQRFEQFIARFPMLVFDHAAARHFGEIRAALARKGTPIGPYDLQIAAIALANDCTLVTHNTVEFWSCKFSCDTQLMITTCCGQGDRNLPHTVADNPYHRKIYTRGLF